MSWAVSTLAITVFLFSVWQVDAKPNKTITFGPPYLWVPHLGI